MDFKDWVIASLGLPQDIGSAIELNLQLAAKTVVALNSSSSRLDEETLTGAMIGALVASHPMSAACFPSDQVSAIQWSGYAKHGSGINSERSSGADFALVISLPDGRLRLAIFQAKSDWSASATKNTLVVGQIKEVPEEKGADGIVVHDAYFRNQIKALVETANGIELKDNKSISISNLSWVHYLCQFQLGIKAVALSQIESHVLQSIESCKEVRFSLTPDKGVQLDLLLKSSCSQKVDGWLDLPTLDDAGLPVAIDLSALVELMPVVVAREGSGGPQVKLVMGVEGTTLSEPLLDLQEPTPVPVPAKTFGMS